MAGSREGEMAAIRYSLVLPVHNERENLPALLAELGEVLPRLGGGYELICVDDGSDDGSREWLQNYRRGDPRCRLLLFAENRGQSAALAAGFARVRGEYVITMDADGQNDPADLPELVAYLGDYDLVQGWRRARRDPWLTRAASRVANAIRNLVTGEGIRDSGCALRIMKSVYLRRVPVFAGMHRFLPALLQIAGARVVELPVRHRPRRAGSSHYGLWRRALSGGRDLLGVRWLRDRAICTECQEDNEK